MLREILELGLRLGLVSELREIGLVELVRILLGDIFQHEFPD